MTPPAKPPSLETLDLRLTAIEEHGMARHHQQIGRLGIQMNDLLGVHGNAGRVKKLEDDIKRLEKMIEVAERQRDAVDFRELERLTMLISAVEKKHRIDIDQVVTRVERVEDVNVAFPWRLLLVTLLGNVAMGVVLLAGLLAALANAK